MRFRLNGTEYELTPEQVRVALRGHRPEAIRQFAVLVDGVEWPVKQVFRLALPGEAFQSQTARRHLAALGFEVLGEARSREATGGAIRRAGPDWGSLPAAETVSATVRFTWRRAGDVTLGQDGAPEFPPIPSAPGLYRFDLRGGSATRPTVYVGESVDLRRRASNYRNARTDRSRQRTSRRVHVAMVDHLRSGGDIEVSICVVVGVDAAAEIDLRRMSARRLAENAAVLSAQERGTVTVMNIDAELDDDT